MTATHNPQEPPTTRRLRGQWFPFPNGYGASVIPDPHDNRFVEIAVMNDRGEFVYDTPITNNVLPCVRPVDVDSVLDRIAALPPRPAAAPSGEASRP